MLIVDDIDVYNKLVAGNAQERFEVLYGMDCIADNCLFFGNNNQIIKELKTQQAKIWVSQRNESKDEFSGSEYIVNEDEYDLDKIKTVFRNNKFSQGLDEIENLVKHETKRMNTNQLFKYAEKQLLGLSKNTISVDNIIKAKQSEWAETDYHDQVRKFIIDLDEAETVDELKLVVKNSKSQLNLEDFTK